MDFRFKTGICLLILLWALISTTDSRPSSKSKKDLRSLNQHFNEPGGDISPWIFIPEDNVKEVSTEESPGLLTVRQVGNGKDIRGILEDPIEINDYPLPWNFHMGLVQNWNALQGVGSPHQMNYAIGLNLVVTFSDPSVWPKDRTQRPPDAREFQLLVVHLGSTGEFSPGLPQYSDSTHPETFLLYGRGDFGHIGMGDWKFPHIYEGSGRDGGPASQEIYFTCSVLSPTTVQVGFRAQPKYTGIVKTIDCSRYGSITGIWEIGPIFSCDRWIPDVLCRNIPAQRTSIYFSGSSEADHYKPRIVEYQTYEPEPPDPNHEFYVDYCTFIGSDLEHASDDFNIRGYLENWQFQLPFAAETWSNPGYLTVTTLGQSQWSGFSAFTAPVLDLRQHQPPFEVEVCMIPPDNTIPWNFHLHQKIFDGNGKLVGYWRPGVQNYPVERMARFHNNSYAENSLISSVHKDWYQLRDLPEGILQKVIFDLTFDPEVPNKVLQHKPLYLLYQVIDSTHVRMGFKANAFDPWILSKVFDCTTIVHGGISQIQEFCFGTSLGRHWGKLPGSPMYQQYKYDYIHFRYGLSSK